MTDPLAPLLALPPSLGQAFVMMIAFRKVMGFLPTGGRGADFIGAGGCPPVYLRLEKAGLVALESNGEGYSPRPSLTAQGERLAKAIVSAVELLPLPLADAFSRGILMAPAAVSSKVGAKSKRAKPDLSLSPRVCKRCHKGFAPTSRFDFLCDYCGGINAGDLGEYGHFCGRGMA